MSTIKNQKNRNEHIGNLEATGGKICDMEARSDFFIRFVLSFLKKSSSLISICGAYFKISSCGLDEFFPHKISFSSARIRGKIQAEKS
jgi:hypothetical protein